MNVCSKSPCGMTTGGCVDRYCPTPQFFQYLPQQPPARYLPVNVPFSNFGVTTVTMDRDCNVTIRVDQVPQSPQESTSE